MLQTFGPSMLPTIDLTTNVFLAEKISTRFGKVAPGDIVFLRNPQDPRRHMTKRVVGLEGDSVTYITNPETYGLEGDSHTYFSNPESNDKPKMIVVWSIYCKNQVCIFCDHFYCGFCFARIFIYFVSLG